MKILKILVLLGAVFFGLPAKIFCCATECISENSFASKKNAVVTCRLAKPEEDLTSTRALWLDAFSKSYDVFSLEDLQVTAFDSKASWLSATFDEELEGFRDQKRTLWLFQTRMEEEVVGAAILEPLKEESSTLYIRQLAVHPSYQNQGIGRGMMETI